MELMDIEEALFLRARRSNARGPQVALFRNVRRMLFSSIAGVAAICSTLAIAR
jgi:hypothetical protein